MHSVRSKHLRLVSAETGLMTSAAPAPTATSTHSLNAFVLLRRAFEQHWPEYAMEAFGLGLFMLSACAFGALLDYPGSPVHRGIPDAAVRRVLFGAAMALTNILNIYSPWGRRSGAHLNPAVTWTFHRLGKVARADALFYTLSQFAGGILGVFVARLFLRSLIAHRAVNYVATTPGPAGVATAFVAEVVITFMLMMVILIASNSARLMRYTGILASLLVMIYISVEAPLSGMSMNPARTLGSAVFAATWTALWIYFIAPPLGMLLAAEVYLRLKGARPIYCAKLHHDNHTRCIFRCRFMELGN
jgi:aquaporin Z